jgi:polar amino acid transport system substrate-binding protein
MIQKSTDRVSVEYGTHVPPVLGNFQRIEQVVINLIQNACRSLPSRDKGVYLSTAYAPEPKAVLIEVRDEGVGIPEEDLKHLGDPFFTTRRAMGGTGLGLWVSFNIVHEHGGTLAFSSREGEGTRAVLSLPVHPQHGFAGGTPSGWCPLEAEV